MMLYLRNGLDKDDFWKAFREELANGLQELLDGKESLDIEEILLQEPCPDEDMYVIDLVKLAEKESEKYPDAAFHLMDDELSDLLIKYGYLPDEDTKEFMGEYVFVWSSNYDTDDPEGYLTIEEMRSGEHEIVFDNKDFMPFMAASSFEDEIFMNSCDTSDFIHDFSIGIALYKKNGKTSADFWRDFCHELLKLLKRNN